MYSGIWMYGWDLADEGIDRVMGWAADSGLTGLQIAGSYHSGWFIHPHNPRHRAYMTEDGTVYFHPQTSLYAHGLLQPRVASVCAQTDWMREVGKRLAKHNLKLVSWTVCCHNTRLGRLHPECTVHNCFGDSYPHALCPANRHVREYLAALCRDLANNLPLHAVQLEAPEFMGLRHGHHHERDLTVLSPLEVELMDLCFCDSCVRIAESKHLDIRRARAAARSTLEAAMAAAPGRPRNHPQSFEEISAWVPELSALVSLRKEIEDTLVHDIRSAMRPSTAELWLLGSPRPGNLDVVHCYNSLFYGQKAPEVLASTRGAAKDLAKNQKLHVGIRLGLDSVADAKELAEIVRAIGQGGGSGVMFYNYSESPMTALKWIKPALAAGG